MSKIVTFKSYQNTELKKETSGLDSAQLGQLKVGKGHLETFSRFVDIWKLWQKKCLLIQ